MQNITSIQKHVVSMLKKGLSAALTYHNINHTLDVATQCTAIAKAEGITNEQQLMELYIAGLYHDCGFLFVYDGHEEIGCKLAREQLPGFGFDKVTIDNICALIMATKMPQSPTNHLQKIICDADLDYLGRGDFFIIGKKIYKEVLRYKIVSSEAEWQQKQVNFLQSHHYFTQTSLQNRTPAKLQHIKILLEEQNGTKYL
jgi:uncharacterized protein